MPPNARRRHGFRASAPGRLLVTDVTEFEAGGGEKACLSPAVDRCDGMPPSWPISRHPDSRLCGSSPLSALDSLPGGGRGAVAHADGGPCYRSLGWKGICAERGVVRSMPVSYTHLDVYKRQIYFMPFSAVFK